MKQLKDFAHIIKNFTGGRGNASALDQLLIDRQGALSMHYAPFEYVNRDAKVVLLGITPGIQQALLALERASVRLQDGASIETIVVEAKAHASFGGTMRASLVQMLDAIGLQRALGLHSTSELWAPDCRLAHFTSCLMYPVLLNGANYSGTPSILSNPWLRDIALKSMQFQLGQLPSDAWWIPLGREPSRMLEEVCRLGWIPPEKVLAGLPHPSGANIERVQAFLGQKAPASCSQKTKAGNLIIARQRLVNQLSGAANDSTEVHSPATSPVADPLHAVQQPPRRIKVPFAKDGSCFHPRLSNGAGVYRVGDKNNEKSFCSFFEALHHLQTMPVAKWRRPSVGSGRPGIVSAVRWDWLELQQSP